MLGRNGMGKTTLFATIAESQQLPQVVRLAAQLVMLIVPNFGQYNVQNSVINSGAQIVGEGIYYTNLAVYGIVYISILLLGAMLIFDRREV